MESVLTPNRPFVNGSYLQKYINKPITLIGSVLKVLFKSKNVYNLFNIIYIILCNFLQVSPDGKSVTLQTTDDQVVTANFHEPIDNALDGWVEVHGFAKDKGTVAGESSYNLPTSVTNDFGKTIFRLY